MNTDKKSFNLSRRSAIKYGGGFIGTGIAATILGGNLNNSQSAVSQTFVAQNKDITPDEALKRLMDGNERFINEKRISPNQTRERIIEVSESQAPFAALLSCADSRVPSEIVFDQGLGDLFVCRIAGNIATSEEIGSLEFGTMILGAKVLMVMGHARCGAVKAAIEGGRFPGRIGSLISSLRVGVERAQRMPGTNKLQNAVEANVLYQVEILKDSAIMGELIDKNQLKIVGAYYDLSTGKVNMLG
ncbi:carbonate dehydratase [Aphanothece hegewaldii CCALA 016]|uniref:carbonic anhydrase n=1 Tax=Aphanothece hegewaldii CCALA 016 TaxID=2107694 RepID=A0A2T1LZN8_9CHRO|nr:carbonic anhydrase [Aphanothece hegewaldii]PSF37862.1 carbonate dehydratase [Aphanothece hegewaldii CCALA 016]